MSALSPEKRKELATKESQAAAKNRQKKKPARAPQAENQSRKSDAVTHLCLPEVRVRDYAGQDSSHRLSADHVPQVQ